jgi:hypothetical protein
MVGKGVLKMEEIRIIQEDSHNNEDQARMNSALALVNTVLQDELALGLIKKLIEEDRM